MPQNLLNHLTSRFRDDQYEQLLASLGQLQRFDVWLESTLVANAWLPDVNEKAVSLDQFPIDGPALIMQNQIVVFTNYAELRGQLRL